MCGSGKPGAVRELFGGAVEQVIQGGAVLIEA